MNAFFSALAEHAFLQHAALAGLLASLGCGVVGSYVVVKRITFLAGGVAHAVLGGVGAALFLGAQPMTGALVGAMAAALLIGWVSLRWRQQVDTLIGATWALGMALGIIFISRTPGYQVDLTTYLFGNILLVTPRDLWLMAILDLVLVTLVLLLHRQFLALAFDEEFARLRGVPVTGLYLLLLCMVAVSVVLLIKIVGLILVIALLTLPAAMAQIWVGTVGRMMVVAAGLGAVFCGIGLAAAYEPDLPPGATIIVVAAVAYLIANVSAAARRRMLGQSRR